MPIIELRPSEIIWLYWQEQIVIEEDAELLNPEYVEGA
jgi:hypothetical protein